MNAWGLGKEGCISHHLIVRLLLKSASNQAKLFPIEARMLLPEPKPILGGSGSAQLAVPVQGLRCELPLARHRESALAALKGAPLSCHCGYAQLREQNCLQPAIYMAVHCICNMECLITLLKYIYI